MTTTNETGTATSFKAWLEQAHAPIECLRISQRGIGGDLARLFKTVAEGAWSAAKADSPPAQSLTSYKMTWQHVGGGRGVAMQIKTDDWESCRWTWLLLCKSRLPCLPEQVRDITVTLNGTAFDPEGQWPKPVPLADGLWIPNPGTLDWVRCETFEYAMLHWFEGFNTPRLVVNGVMEDFAASDARVKEFYRTKPRS